MKMSNLGTAACAVLVLIAARTALSQSKPEPVPYIRQSGVLPQDWYQQQAELWRQEVAKQPQHAAGWKNYYLATEYSYFGKGPSSEKAEKLDAILSAMGKAIPTAYEYLILQYRRFSTDKALLEKAHQLRPEQSDHYCDLIVAYEVERKLAAANTIHRKLYESREIAPALLDYNYNVLMSTEKNAILFTNGDNDTYPLWLLQRIKNIRADVTVLNVHLVQGYPDYLKKLLQERQITLAWSKLPAPGTTGYIAALCQALAPSAPVYFALTVEQSYFKPLAENLFVVGMAYEYRPRRFDNLSVLQKNWEQNFRLDYLQNIWYDESIAGTRGIMTDLNGNYLAPLLLLHEHAKAQGDLEKSNRLRDLAFVIAQQTNKTAALQHMLDEK